MSTKEEPVEVSVKKLRKALQTFNSDLGVYINDDQRYRLGRVLTIIDAAIPDLEQRKAIKDLVNSEWWSGYRNDRITAQGVMTNPHSEIRGLTKALGFELFEPSNADVQPAYPDKDWAETNAISKYNRAINEEQ